MAVDLMDDFELERLRAEIQQERQMREMLDQSSAELRTTVEELDKRLETIGDEGNEWKTRFETQEEMNQQLQKQILLLQTKVEEARKNLKDAGRTPRDMKNFDDLSDASPQMVKALEKEKHTLMNQLRDLEWRLDQESKVYHKANDERKQYVLEINSTKSNINELRVQSKMSSESARNSKTPRNAEGNIPDDQRIIDPKKGPIRKTAGVKSLPSIDTYY